MNRRSLAWFVGHVCLFFAPNLSYGQTNFWQQTNGPYDGSVYELSMNPSGLMLAIEDGKGLYRSFDKGKTWTRIADTMTNYLSYGYPNIAFAPNGTIYIGSNQGVFQSNDNGTSWKYSGLSKLDVGSIAVDSSGLILAGTYLAGNYRSSDGGGTWERIAVSQDSFRDIKIRSDGTIFASDGTVYWSKNSGINWTRSDSGLTSSYIHLLAVSPAGYVFAASWVEGEGIFRSTDNGRSWTHCNFNFSNSNIESISIEPNGIVFVGTRSYGVYSSTDNGNSWSQTGLTSNSVFSLTSSVDGEIFAGTYASGIFRSTDLGKTWVNIGCNSSFVTTMLVDSSGQILANNGYGGLVRSTDLGDTWQNTGLSSSLSSIWVTSIAVNPSGHLFAGTWFGNGVFRSTDNGRTWVSCDSGLTNKWIEALTVTQTGTILAGTFQGGLFRSTNNGISWSAVNTGLTSDEWIFCFAFDSSGHIFAGTWARGICRSTDNGITWTRMNDLSSTSIYSIAINKVNQIFVRADNGVFRSTDYGETWIPTAFADQGGGGIITNSANHIIASTYDGVSLSTDEGASWVSINAGTDLDIRVITLTRNDFLVAGSYGKGVFRSRMPTSSISIYPILSSVMDVPNDRGKHVFVKWNASQLDTNTSTLPFYSIWRSLPGNDAFSNAAGKLSSTKRNMNKSAIRYKNVNGALYAWELIANQPAHRFPSYAFSVPTLYDSSATTNGIHYFLVSAQTNDPNVFYDSNADSGYSVDNLDSLATHIQQNENSEPTSYQLGQNYPNPFNPSTIIDYQLPQAAKVSLKVYDMLGREVALLVDNEKDAGYHAVTFDGSRLSSGVYFTRFIASPLAGGSNGASKPFVQVHKMLFVK
jgi:ligand-binding sensor domain-containing protein